MWPMWRIIRAPLSLAVNRMGDDMRRTVPLPRARVLSGLTFLFALAAPAMTDELAASLSSRPPQQPSSRKVFDVDRAYGTLEFRGQIERLDAGDEYQFRPRLSVAFRAGATVNRTPTSTIDLTLFQLVATIPRANRPAEITHRDVQPISILLTQDGESIALPELLFRVPKSAFADAAHVGFGVSDGRLLWPIAVELK